MSLKIEITGSLRQLHLPAFVDNYDVQATVATNEGWAYDRYLVALCDGFGLGVVDWNWRNDANARPNGSCGNRSCPGRRPGRPLISRDCREPSSVASMHCSRATSWIALRTSWPSAIRAAVRPICCVPSVMNSS